MTTAGATSPRAAGSDPTKGRWLLVGAAMLVQLSTGAVYAWSVFSKALQREDSVFALSKTEAAIPFSVTIGTIFIGTYIGGRIQDRKGPRLVALVGSVLYSLGILLTSMADSRGDYWMLIVFYGVMGGIGLGLAYIVPIAMLQKWFPDKRGLIVGLAVGGFGFGALITSPLARILIEGSPTVPTRAFFWLGLAYLVASVLGASLFKNPPAGYAVPGWQPKPGGTTTVGRDYTQDEALRTPQWYLLTAILTLNVTAGIALIAVAAAAATDIAGYTDLAAASIVGFWAIFNGAGRIVWGAASDSIGRMPAFLAMLGIQGVCFLLLPHTGNKILFFVLGALIYLCYGGGFGTMPATAGDYFGLKNAGAIYGLMIVAWSIGGVLGPQLAAALAGEGNYTRAFTTIGIIALASMALPLITKRPRSAPGDARAAGSGPGSVDVRGDQVNAPRP